MSTTPVTEQPCECGALITNLPANVSHCWCHHVNEPIPADVYQVCFECGHVYATAADLLAAYERETKRLQESDFFPDFPDEKAKRPSSADEIFFCQECIHDF